MCSQTIETFDQQCGYLCAPNAAFLAGCCGIHARNWLGEWSFNRCMEERNDEGVQSQARKKHAALDQFCQNFSAVFGRVEMFERDLLAWHTANMAYTRTFAVSRIVGHMLGIGDRHHRFWKLLLNRGVSCVTQRQFRSDSLCDIVDGTGRLGTDGPFTAEAETSSRILRENSDTLHEILSGLVSDLQCEKAHQMLGPVKKTRKRVRAWL
ncbi:hypothetical protein MHU86_6560 [Fragilaria crotonensis]|nr:hypothetical protein MHU86_18469 [Fragilaria crotonensis]KAI2507902.1 hypothetical protein MHU86_6560 [Fragilaria crotonensis]